MFPPEADSLLPLPVILLQFRSDQGRAEPSNFIVAFSTDYLPIRLVSARPRPRYQFHIDSSKGRCGATRDLLPHGAGLEDVSADADLGVLGDSETGDSSSCWENPG